MASAHIFITLSNIELNHLMDKFSLSQEVEIDELDWTGVGKYHILG